MSQTCCKKEKQKSDQSRFSLIVCFIWFFQSDDEVEGDVDNDDVDTDEERDPEKREKMRELISKKLQKDKGAEKTTDLDEDERGKKSSRRYDRMIPTAVNLSRSLNIRYLQQTAALFDE